MQERVTFCQGLGRLNAVLRRLDAEVTRDRAEIDCERCGYWPCVCETPEFEVFNSQQLDKSSDMEVL
jgi:hypothetical protein